MISMFICERYFALKRNFMVCLSFATFNVVKRHRVTLRQDVSSIVRNLGGRLVVVLVSKTSVATWSDPIGPGEAPPSP